MSGLKLPGESRIQPPEILIFFHIPKTGGTSMDAVLSRCFPHTQHFNGAMADMRSALSIRPREKIEARYHALDDVDKRAIRCVMGTHYPFGIHTMLDGPAKYFSLLRPPIERSVSHFLNNQKLKHLPSYDRVKNMTLDDYLDSGAGIEMLDCQVRLLSGCPELDVSRLPAGEQVSAPPVALRHLELAKRNIEQHFLAVAPLEAFNSLLLMLRSIYGWKLWQLLYVRHNIGSGRITTEGAISTASRKRLEEMNRYDMQLYEWVKVRFAEQMEAMEPALSRDLRHFELLNAAAQTLHGSTPEAVRKLASRVLYTHRAA
jgi:hypothetical protein